MYNSRFYRINAVTEITGYSRSSIYRLENAGLFPARVKLGPKSVTQDSVAEVSRGHMKSGNWLKGRTDRRVEIPISLLAWYC